MVFFLSITQTNKYQTYYLFKLVTKTEVNWMDVVWTPSVVFLKADSKKPLPTLDIFKQIKGR